MPKPLFSVFPAKGGPMLVSPTSIHQVARFWCRAFTQARPELRPTCRRVQPAELQAHQAFMKAITKR